MYKKIFMIIMLVLCFSMVGCAGLFQDEEKTVVSEDLGVLIWPETELSHMIPKPEAEKGKIEQLSNDVFALYIGEVSESYFEKYVTDCIALGFNKNFSYSNNIFSGKNDTGYSLFMRFNNKIMYIKLESPNVQNNENKDDNTGNNENINTSTQSIYTLGMGVVVSLGNGWNAIEVDSTVAAVVLDQDGKIVACRIDALQNKATVDYEGYLTHSNGISKAELKEGYNMAAALNYGMDWNGDGIVKEWYLQAQAFENYVVGMTVAEVEAMPLQTMDNGYIISAEDALLSAGCTIQIAEFKDAVVKACEDDQYMTFSTDEDFTLGVAVKGYLDAGSRGANDGIGEARLYSDYACSVVVDGKIVAALNDSIQPRISFSSDLIDVQLTYKGTKRELKEQYNLGIAVNFGSNYDPNGDGVVLEWYLQSAEFSNYVVGMTAAEVANLETAENYLGSQMSTDDDLLAAGCTIQITEMQAVVATSAQNAR